MKVYVVFGLVLLQVIVIGCAEGQEVAVAAKPPAIPYVATHHNIVRDMLWMAEVGPEDIVYDLGSGDGRIPIAAVRDFGAQRAVGIEIDPELVRRSREAAALAGVADRVQFIEGNFFKADFSEANVITLFVGKQTNLELRSVLFRMLRPGTRIVSHQYGMGEWVPDKSLNTRTSSLGMHGTVVNGFENFPQVPYYDGYDRQTPKMDKVNLWVLPAPIAGVWRGEIETVRGPWDVQLSFHQRLSRVSGKVEISGDVGLYAEVSSVDIWGDHIRFEYHSGWHQATDEQVHLYFDGHALDDLLQGRYWLYEGGEMQVCEWTGRRAEADFIGTWEWQLASVPRSVQLRIERFQDKVEATFVDRGERITVPDFYDFGGGVYFTLLLGRNKEGGITLSHQAGWLIGEAIEVDTSLKGTIEFYPHPWILVPREVGDPSEEVDENNPLSSFPFKSQRGADPTVEEWTPHLIE